MKITDDFDIFLEGKEFSNGIPFNFPLSVYPENRVDYLEKIAAGKKVIHVGCLDHLPLVEKKIMKGSWLHQKLTRSSSKCIGFDINKDGVEEVSKKYKIDNVYFEDIVAKKSDLISSEKWDFMILGEILEHVGNPVDFLISLNEKYAGNVDKIIITVPNVIQKVALKNARKGYELINTDHKFWFTPYTIMKVATASGMKPMDIEFKNRIPLNFIELVSRKIFKILLRKEPKYPFYYYSTLVLICDI